MGMIRRILNIGVGLAAGALAYKLLGDYNKNQMVEGEFTVMDPPETHGPEQAGPAAGETASTAEAVRIGTSYLPRGNIADCKSKE